MNVQFLLQLFYLQTNLFKIMDKVSSLITELNQIICKMQSYQSLQESITEFINASIQKPNPH